MKRKRITKSYEGGGWTAGSGFSGTNVGMGLGAFGGMAGGLIENADMKDGYMSTGGALGSGALKGVSMGASFGPLGMLVGAGLGAASGLMKKQQINDAEDARLRAIEDEKRLRANMENQMKHQQMNQVLDQFPVKGNNTPRFAMGGPTGGGFDTSRMMIPTYAPGAGPNAMPSFDFYTDGQQVSAQDYIAGLPQGQSINDHSQYWTSTLKPQFDQATQTWSNTGQNPMAQSVYGTLQEKAMGGHTKKYEGGGVTGDTDPVNTDLTTAMGNVRAFGLHPMAQEYANKYPSMRDALGNMSQEDFSEFKGKVNSLKQGAQGLKGKGIGAALGFLSNADLSFIKPLRESAGFERGEMVDEILGQTDLGWAGRTAAKGAIMTKDFAMGGTTMGPGYEVEGGEMMQTKGETPQTYGQGGMSRVASTEYEVQGPKHSNGGVQANDNQGARVYSDKLTVDSALLNKLSKL